MVQDFEQYVLMRRSLDGEVFLTLDQYKEQLGEARRQSPGGVGGPGTANAGIEPATGDAGGRADSVRPIGPFTSLRSGSGETHRAAPVTSVPATEASHPATIGQLPPPSISPEADVLGNALRRLGLGNGESARVARGLLERGAQEERERLGREAAERFATDYGRRLGQSEPNAQVTATVGGARSTAAMDRAKAPDSVSLVADTLTGPTELTLLSATGSTPSFTEEGKGMDPPVAVAVAAVVEQTGGVSVPSGAEAKSPICSPGGSRFEFYAVYRGLEPGIYRHWSVASLQVIGQPRNSYKGFRRLTEAVDSMRAAGYNVTDDGDLVTGE